MIGKPHLQFCCGANLMLLHEALHFLAGSPFVVFHFVASDVYDIRWEQVGNFVEHIVNKLLHLRIHYIEDSRQYTKTARYLYRLLCATKIWVGGNSSRGMSGEFYFWNNLDVMLGGIRYDFADVVLCVISTHGSRVEDGAFIPV